MRWNEERGLTSLNLELENDMLEEEKKEFWDDYERFTEFEAGDNKLNAIVGMVDALCDYTFVAIGTDTKVAKNILSIQNKVIVNALKSDIEKQIGLMEGILRQLLGNVFNVDICFNFVLEANNKKPNKQNAAGKNIKGTEWEDPKGRIKEYLLTLSGIEEYSVENKVVK
jgi:hypothetical protein